MKPFCTEDIVENLTIGHKFESASSNIQNTEQYGDEYSTSRHLRMEIMAD